MLWIKRFRNKKGQSLMIFLIVAMCTLMITGSSIILTAFLSMYIVNVSVICLDTIELIKSKTNYYWLGIDKGEISLKSDTGVGSEFSFYLPIS